ncbi:MAG: ABC transporter ATP-binding protein [Spirochaetota bacterium]
MVKVDNVSKVYKVGALGGRRLEAVSRVSFEIPDGQVVSLIGESGSGKSTIGKMMLGITPITSGTISIDGEDITELLHRDKREYYRRVQGVFQDPFSSYNPIFKADRVFRIIREEFYPNVKEAEWKAKVHDAVRAVGLNPAHVLNKYPHQLSGGQLQRFLIARALLLDIKFLVADEIISMLDASTRIDVLNLLAEVKKRGLSILFITHDLSLANYISERAIILYRGRIAEYGLTEKIFGNPLHPYTRMLLESVPRLDQEWKTEEISLETKPEIERHAGCVYYDRCPVSDVAIGCTAEEPPLVEVEPDHWVSCYHYTGSEATESGPEKLQTSGVGE